MCTLLFGCGKGESPNACAINVQVSGAVTWSYGSENPACLIPFSGSTGILMYFKPVSGDVSTFIVDVQDVKEGQTGAFPAGVQLETADRRVFKTSATGCTLRVDEQVFDLEDEFRKQYLTKGSGECAVEAMPFGGSGAAGAVTIAPFTYLFPANYDERAKPLGALGRRL